MTLVLMESFQRACRRVPPEQQASIMEMLVELRATLADVHRHSGRGLRKVHPAGFWEVRVGLQLRAVFRLEGERAVFHFLGGHDEVRRFLRDFRAS